MKNSRGGTQVILLACASLWLMPLACEGDEGGSDDAVGGNLGTAGVAGYVPSGTGGRFGASGSGSLGGTAGAQGLGGATVTAEDCLLLEECTEDCTALCPNDESLTYTCSCDGGELDCRGAMDSCTATTDVLCERGLEDGDDCEPGTDDTCTVTFGQNVGTTCTCDPQTSTWSCEASEELTCAEGTESGDACDSASDTVCTTTGGGGPGGGTTTLCACNPENSEWECVSG